MATACAGPTPRGGVQGGLHGVPPRALTLSRALTLCRFNVLVYLAIFTVVVLVGLDTYVDNVDPATGKVLPLTLTLALAIALALALVLVLALALVDLEPCPSPSPSPGGKPIQVLP